MSDLERSWPLDAFDAISIVAVGGRFEIEGSDGDEVELEAEIDKRTARDLKLEPVERWLQLQLWEHPREGEITLRLPRKKAWVIDLSAAQGEVEVKRLQARLRVMLGKGEIEIEDCRGIFNLAAGKGEVELERCTEADAPARPPMPQFEGHFQIPPIPEGAGATGEFRFHMGRGPRMRHGRQEMPWDWFGFDSQDWSQWGTQVGEQARVWAQQFVNQFVGGVDWLPEKHGIGLRIGKGNAQLRAVEAKSCAIYLGNGDVELKRGRIGELHVSLGHGGVECESILPTGSWEIEARHGDIQLALPSDTHARLDVATRHGDIDSEVPLVRVGRPGPEARHGGRMVGTVGQGESPSAEINLTAQSGDIKIELEHSASGSAGAAASQTASEQKTATGDKTSQKQNPAAGVDVPVPVDVPVDIHVPSVGGAAETPAPEQQRSAAAAEPAYDSQFAILQALSQGQISVDEAEKLLASLTR